MVRIADDVRVQDVAAEKAFLAIVMIASKAVGVPVVIKNPLCSNAAPFGIGENVAGFGRRLHAINRCYSRPSRGRGLHQRHHIRPGGAWVECGLLPGCKFCLHSCQCVLATDAAVACEFPFIPRHEVLLHGGIEKTVGISIVLLLVGQAVQ